MQRLEERAAEVDEEEGMSSLCFTVELTSEDRIDIRADTLRELDRILDEARKAVEKCKVKPNL